MKGGNHAVLFNRGGVDTGPLTNGTDLSQVYKDQFQALNHLLQNLN